MRVEENRREFLALMVAALATTMCGRERRQPPELVSAGDLLTMPPATQTVENEVTYAPCPDRPASSVYRGWADSLPITDAAKKTKQLMIDQLNVDAEEVKPGARLCEDLGANSVDFAVLVMEFEVLFELEISPQDALCMKTVGDFSNFVHEREN